MKKVIILAVIACLGLGTGVFFATKIQDGTISQIISGNDVLQSGPWNVKHPKWSGTLVKNGKNRLRSNVNGDTATIISAKNGVLTVKWDRWGTESFKCNTQNSCTLK